MLLRTPFAALAVALMTACSGEVASGGGGDGGHDNQDSGHPTSDAGHPGHDAGHPGHDAAQGGDAHRGHDSGLAPPMSHRPTHESCMSTRPPGLQDGGLSEGSGLGGTGCYLGQDGTCTSDSQCPATNDAGWTNGRCTPFDQTGVQVGCPSCQYDQCSTDSQCGTGSVCECGGDVVNGGPGRYANACLTGNCQVDSDCGSGGYCSPDVGPCGQGTIGYYCHTADDQCDNDSDCQNSPSGGLCVYDMSMKIWDCLNQACPG
jgi:hypothetical protein